MAVPKVDKKMLEELEAMGFPKAKATRALHYSGNNNVDDAINWIFDHENDPDIDEIPLERIQAGKKLNEMKRIAEENERQRNIAMRKAEKQEEKRAREKVIQKLEQDKFNRRSKLGLPLEGHATVKYSATTVQKEQDEHARVRRAFETLLIYVGNVVKSPNQEKYRKIRLSNPLFQDRVGSLNGGVEFLELCGFERMGDFLYLPEEKVDITLLNSAGFVLKSAITNPFFGLFSTRTLL